MAEIYCLTSTSKFGMNLRGGWWGKHTDRTIKSEEPVFWLQLLELFLPIFSGRCTLKRSAKLGKFRLRQCSKPFLQLGGCFKDFWFLPRNLGNGLKPSRFFRWKNPDHETTSEWNTNAKTCLWIARHLQTRPEFHIKKVVNKIVCANDDVRARTSDAALL